MLSEFINYNSHCPSCGEPLHLYMHWNDSISFEGERINETIFQFTPSLLPERFKHLGGEQIYLGIEGPRIGHKITNNQLAEEAKLREIYFFYLCNKKGFKQIRDGDFQISLYKACYYRSSPFFEYKKDGETWLFQYKDENQKHMVNKDESFVLNSKVDDLEKVYMLNLDYEDNVTELWYYSVTDEEKKKVGFDPKLFDKKLPMLKGRPMLSSAEDKEKLMERFDGWIIMS